MEKRCQSDLLDNLYIAAPCTIAWDTMQGDDRKRLCSGCSRHVFNVSDMTRNEANQFLEENGTTQCMIFYRRQDGTIMTDNCPVGLRKLRDKAKAFAGAAAAAVAFVLSWTSALAQSANDTASGAKKPARPFTQRGLVGEPTNPAPSGFKYHGNPAGGGFILVPNAKPDGTVISTDGKVKIQSQPVLPVPGQAVVVPTLPQPEKMIKGKPVIRHEPDPVVPTGSMNTHIEKHSYIDKSALESFKKGKEALADGKNSLAEFHFEKALAAFEKQRTRDAKFRELIEASLKKSRGL